MRTDSLRFTTYAQKAQVEESLQGDPSTLFVCGGPHAYSSSSSQRATSLAW